MCARGKGEIYRKTDEREREKGKIVGNGSRRVQQRDKERKLNRFSTCIFTMKDGKLFKRFAVLIFYTTKNLGYTSPPPPQPNFLSRKMGL